MNCKVCGHLEMTEPVYKTVTFDLKEDKDE